MTRGVLDKLKRIKADLVRGQENWQDWDLPRLAQALKKWRNVNPATEDSTVPNKTIPPLSVLTTNLACTMQTIKPSAIVFIVKTPVTSRGIARAYPR